MKPGRVSRWFDAFGRHIVLQAACGLPGPLRDRFGEEWLSDLGQMQDGLARLRFALGCCRAAAVLRWSDMDAGAGAEAGAAHAHVPPEARSRFVRFAADDCGLFTDSSVPVALIASLQSALVCAIALGVR